jgi:predicted ArsR family transcriptional regulator
MTARPLSQSGFDSVLVLLKKNGPMTIQEVSGHLELTAEGARQKLKALFSEGLVHSQSEKKGVGRPTQRWSVSEKGVLRFTDSHADLSVQLIEGIHSALGEAALSKVFQERETRLFQYYRKFIPENLTVKRKLNILSLLRTKEGYEATLERKDGNYLLTENHCPICSAAKACSGFCDSELSLFKNLLGPEVEIERTETLAAEGRKCVYVIKTS